MVAGVPQLSGRVRDGDTVIVDANHGYILVNPSALALQEYRMHRELLDRFRTELAELRDVPAVTPDGRVIHLGANVGLLEEVPYALAQGAESIEVSEPSTSTWPMANPLPRRSGCNFYTTVVRSVAEAGDFTDLDLGGDKSPSASSTAEANPVLGNTRNPPASGAKQSLRRPDRCRTTCFSTQGRSGSCSRSSRARRSSRRRCSSSPPDRATTP